MRPMPFALMELLYKESMEEPLTPAEQLRLMEWRENVYEAPLVSIQMADMEMMELYFLLDHFEKTRSHKRRWIRKRLASSNANEYTETPHLYRGMALKIWSAIAAAVVIIAFIWSLLQQNNDATGHRAVTTASSTPVIPPGLDHILLTLPGGQTLPLPKSAVIRLKGSTLNIAYISKPGLIVEGSQVSSGHPAALSFGRLPDSLNKTEFTRQFILPSAGDIQASIATSKGCTYKVTLPDGSVAWLNAASSLKLPLQFNSHRRQVELQGEAYFEVTKDSSRPFIVSAGNAQVEVLGTRFNITAYPDKPFVKTALLEGRIKLSHGSEERMLQPGQQALAANGTIKTEQANVEPSNAWINGVFYFNRNSIDEVMERIARWYDVQVEFRDKPVPNSFMGKFPMSTPLPHLLKMLENTKEVHFEINGNKVIVMKYRGS